jgi:nickel/cobalt exporter
MHAVEPGHGKTVVAAYLVGTRGRNMDAVILGLVVTFTHTFSIIVLAVIARSTSRYFSEEILHSYLGIISSMLILGIGIWMMRTRWAALKDPSRAHHHKHFFHSHEHEDHDHTHSIQHHKHDHTKEQDVNLRGLLLLGISGGIIPCPAAIAILLASVSTGNIGKGLWLVIIFSLGLAVALVAIGLIIVNSFKAGEKFLSTEKYAPLAAFLSAVVITFIGGATLYSSFKHFVV